MSNPKELVNLKAIFQALDLNGNGFLEKSELEGYLNLRGFSQKESDELFMVADVNKDGKISVKEFIKAFSKTYE